MEQGERWRERRAAAKESAAEAAHLSDAEGRWQAYVGPEEARLEDAIYQARRDVEGIVASQERPAARWWAWPSGATPPGAFPAVRRRLGWLSGSTRRGQEPQA